MLLFTSSSNSNHALCGLTLGLTLLLVTVSAQNQLDQFVIRVAELLGVPLNAAPATGLGATASGATQTALQAPDVVVEGLNLAQRNNLIAAAGNEQVPAPHQRKRLHMNSGLRRRR